MAQTNASNNTTLRAVIIGGLILAAFFGAYRFASARNNQVTPAAAQASAAAGSQQAATSGGSGQGSTGGSGSGSSAGGCACCGGGSTAPTANGVIGSPVTGTSQLSGGVQTISVNVTTVYTPNVIKLKAGVPAEITFSQASSCASQIVSEDLGFSVDSSTGPKTVKLGALKKGTYSFHCGMGMVFGKIVVE